METTDSNPKFSTAPLHAQVQERYAKLSPVNIAAIIFTDGAGHKDRFAGSSASVFIPGDLPAHIVAAASHSSTERGEFEALLRGLQYVEEKLALTKGQREMAKMLPVAQRRQIVWHTDRESLALCVARANGGEGQPFFSRRSTPDMWAMFEYFEAFLSIHALFAPRCSNPSMDLVDMLASDARQTLKNFYLSTFPPANEQ